MELQAEVSPWQQEGRSHSDPGGEGDDVGDNQVTLKTHHQDHEGNHRLKNKKKNIRSLMLSVKRVSYFPPT